MKKTLTLLSIVLFTSFLFGAGVIYTWVGSSPSSWATSTNWSPERTTPAVTDIIQFNTSATVTGVPTQTIAQLIITSNSTVTLSSTAAVTLTIGNAAGDSLYVGAGSTLNVSGSYALTIALSSVGKGEIYGNISMYSTSGSIAHRLTSSGSSNPIIFHSGSVMTFGPYTGGNVFGTTAFNSVIFQSGSIYVSKGGANPFGASQPNSVVTFQSGSLYRHEQSGAPAFSGRTYADFEHNYSGANTITGTSASSVNNLTISQGTFNYNMTRTPGHAIKGNITVKSGATLNFNPGSAATINFSGTTNQLISGAGTLTMSATNSTFNLTNSQGVTLAIPITYFKMTLNNNPLILSGKDITLSGNVTITNTTPLNVTTTTTSSWPNYINKQWSITGSASGNVDIIYFWSSSDDNNFSWGTLIPAVWKGGIKYTPAAGNYNVSTSPRWLKVSVPLTSSKDTSIIGRDDGGTLPVELTSFTADFTQSTTGDMYVSIKWTTQSETALAGYYIYRGTTNDLSAAEKIPSLIAPVNSSHGASYEFIDREIQSGTTYYYWLQSIEMDGSSDFHGPVSVTVNEGGNITPPAIITETRLLNAYPNPFNPTTTLCYTLKERGQAKIEIYNVRGQLIRSFMPAPQDKGYYQIIWDGKDLNGTQASSGVYYVRMTCGKYVSSQRIVLMK